MASDADSFRGSRRPIGAVHSLFKMAVGKAASARLSGAPSRLHAAFVQTCFRLTGRAAGFPHIRIQVSLKG